MLFDEPMIYDKIPNWLRWILLLPIAYLYSLLGELLYTIGQWFNGLNTQGASFNFMILSVSIIGFLVGIEHCAPNYKKEMVIIFSSMILVLGVILFYRYSFNLTFTLENSSMILIPLGFIIIEIKTN